jgi:protein TonB
MPLVRGGRETVNRCSSGWPLERRLGVAVAVSLAVHAAVMSLSFPAPRVSLFEPARALQVSLRELTMPPVVAPEPAIPAPAAPVPEKRRPEPKKQAAGPLVRRSDVPAPSPVAAPHVDEEPVKAAVPDATVAAAPQPPPAAPPPLTLQAAAPQPSRGDLLLGYGQAISRALAPYKEYPPVAQMQGWQGAVTMRLRVAPSGRLIDAQVHASSGHEVLDRQALAMASKPERYPAPPEELRDREVAVLVPVVFRLER